MNKTKHRPSVWKLHGWKIGYFIAGILLIGLGKYFIPFGLRITVLAGWAIGLAILFIRTLDAQKEEKEQTKK